MPKQVKFSMIRKSVQLYLQEQFAGQAIYVPKRKVEKTSKHTKSATRWLAIKAMRKAKCSEKEICKVLRLCPSEIKRIEDYCTKLGITESPAKAEEPKMVIPI